MRLFPNALLMLALSVMVASCEKDTVGDGLTCDELTDDVVIADGKAFQYYTDYPSSCMTINPFGPTRHVHGRVLTHGSGNTLTTPEIVITLSDVPPANATTTYQVTNGMPWLLNGDLVQGLAKVTVNRFEETLGQQETWSSDERGGTVQVTTDGSGGIIYNFSVHLAKHGGFVSDPLKTFCGQNIVCRTE